MLHLLQHETNRRNDSFSSNLSQHHSNFNHILYENHYWKGIGRRFRKQQPEMNENNNKDYQRKLIIAYAKQAIATVYRKMSKKKKDIVEEMGFGALANVSEMNVSNTLLKELLDRFDEEKGCLKTLQGKIYITHRKVADALGITNGGNHFPDKVDYNNLNLVGKEIFDSVKNIFLATLTRNVLDMSVEGEENQKKFKRTFVVFIQKCFLLPTTVSVASPIHKPPIFYVDNIRECDWAKHVLNFLMKGVENKRKGRKQSVDGCVFVLMLIYFHEIKFPRPFAPDAPCTTQGSSTPSVNAASNSRKMCLNVTRATPDSELQIVEFRQETRSQPLEVPPLALSLPSSVQEELIRDDFIYVPPQNETQQTSNNDRPLEQQQQPCKEPTAQQSEQEALVDVAAQPRQRKNERPSFSLGISPPASQPTQPSQESVSQLEILAEAVVDAGVTAALKFAKATTLEPTLPAAEVFKTPEKKIKISKDLIEKCYHWMTHVKKTNDSSNEYEAIFVLKHEALYEGLREYFMSLKGSTWSEWNHHYCRYYQGAIISDPEQVGRTTTLATTQASQSLTWSKWNEPQPLLLP
ncbi:hypothetical protein Ahy_B02g058258 [Arachis hypogaea]|uniref:Uncharacterized protein n=1 Tax=Arachis hypogaea TaxID=3818 RepID=A0A445AE97_ARAHY|nr:hypothetical protein Ahy_B02g058258 [Arachis hypogaea]